mgnify:FL=1
MKGARKVRNEAIRIRIEAVPRVVSNNTLSEDKSFIAMGVYQNETGLSNLSCRDRGCLPEDTK